ncbi:MAG: crossover junction endodeoxyribonuclease RuvC [Proteobacteria bacterium]|nr:crossover junction endodeoxyribonuclease RuvC [Pseudomonadota bacterium]
MNRIIGIDPGLQRTGWGIIEAAPGTLRFAAGDVIQTDPTQPLPLRLLHIRTSLLLILQLYQPQAAAMEETFVNRNFRSSLLLSQARGVALVSLAEVGLVAAEYTPNAVKKSITGRGHSDKTGMLQMLRYILPGASISQADTADAVSIAICHANHMRFT